MDGNQINMINVSSSNVYQVGYDYDNQTLYMTFLNGSTYIYKGVNQNEFDGLLNAPSIGSYIHRNIRNFYPYEKIG